MNSELGFLATTFFLPYTIIFFSAVCLFVYTERVPMGAWCTLYMYLNLHLFPSYAWNNKHCYGSDNTNSCWQADGHINGHNTGMREQFPAPTHREAEWSVLHSGTGEALLTLECAAVFMLNSSSCWWGLIRCLSCCVHHYTTSANCATTRVVLEHVPQRSPAWATPINEMTYKYGYNSSILLHAFR